MDPNMWPDVFDVYQPDGRTPLALENRLIARALRGETTSEFVFVLRPREGKKKEIRLAASGYPLRGDDGKPQGGAVLLRNATDAAEQSARAQRFEAELHERLQVLNAIIRSISEGVVVADAQERLTLFNPSAKRILGLGVTARPPEEWPEFYGIFYPDTSTPVPPDELPVVRAVRGETVEDMELFIRNPRVPDGVHISVNASPLRDESQNAVGGVAVFRDVSGAQDGGGGPGAGLRPRTPGGHRHGAAQHRERDQQRRDRRGHAAPTARRQRADQAVQRGWRISSASTTTTGPPGWRTTSRAGRCGPSCSRSFAT